MVSLSKWHWKIWIYVSRQSLSPETMLRTGLTVHMAILEGAEAVIVEKVEAPGMLRLSTWLTTARCK